MMRSGCLPFAAMVLSVILLVAFALVPMAVSAENENAVYVSAGGSDSNDGSEKSPFLTLDKGIRTVAEKYDGDGTVYVVGKIEEGSPSSPAKSYSYSNWTKPMKIMGKDSGKIDFKNDKYVNFMFSGPVLFDSISFSFGAYQDSDISRIVRFYNQGNRFEFGEHVLCDANFGSLYIIGNGVTSEEKGIFLHGGSVGTIWLALNGTSDGNNVYLTVSDNALVGTVFTGSSGSEARVNGLVKIIDGGTVNYFYAGGQRATVSGDVTLICSGGYIQNAVGQSNANEPIKGKASLYLSLTDAAGISSVGGFDEVHYFSASTNGLYDAQINSKTNADYIYTTKIKEANGKENNLSILGSFEMTSSAGDENKPEYYIIPIDNNYVIDGNFRLLNEKKQVIDGELTSMGFIVNGLATLETKGYLAYDTSSGDAPQKRQESESDKKVIPPIPVLEVTPNGTDANQPQSPVTEPSEGIDISLMVMIALSVAILGAGIFLSARKK